VNIALLSKFTEFPGMKFFTHVFLKTVFLVAVSCVIPFLVRSMMEEGLLRFLIVCSLSVICTFITIYYWGLSKEARQMVDEKVIGRFRKFFKKIRGK